MDRQISSFCGLNHDLATNDIIFFAETVTQLQTSKNIFCADISERHAQLFSNLLTWHWRLVTNINSFLNQYIIKMKGYENNQPLSTNFLGNVWR